MTDEAAENDWERIWDARIEGLARVFGEPSDTVLHSPTPFELGGFADVVSFPHHQPGVTYVTAELTGEDVGQLPNLSGHYELVVCTKQELKRAGDLISLLARYACQSVLEKGDTMDLKTFFGESSIRGLVFSQLEDEKATFEFLGQRYGLLLCIGITSDELAFGRAKGTRHLLSSLRESGVFPYTIPNRRSIVLPGRS